MLLSLLACLLLLLLLWRHAAVAARATSPAQLVMRSFRSASELRPARCADAGVGERSQSFTSGVQPACSCNFRDCGLVHPSLRPGLVFRSSQVVSSAEVRKLRLGSVLDLRVLKKPCKKHESELLLQQRAESRCQLQAQQAAPDASRASTSSDEDSGASQGGREAGGGSSTPVACPICSKEWGLRHRVLDVPVYHSDMVPWQAKMRVFGKLPLGTQAAAIRELCHLRSPTPLVARAVVDPAVMGPTVLYRVLLDHSRASVAKALRIFARAGNFPVLVHCIHGKDRTGLVVMLLLLLCDVPAELVVQDYIQSELQLKAGRDKGDLAELDDFLVSDNVIASKAETMLETIGHIRRAYGGARGYCAAIGLSEGEVAAIRANLLAQAETSDLLDRLPCGPEAASSAGHRSAACKAPVASQGLRGSASSQQSSSSQAPVSLLDCDQQPLPPPPHPGAAHAAGQQPARWPAAPSWAAANGFPRSRLGPGVPVGPASAGLQL